MSKIALSPNASGTGTLNIAAPNTNSTRTLTLPDADLNLADVLTSVSSLASANLTGALPAIDGSALTGVGGSTTFGAVGTYALLYDSSKTQRVVGTTMSGSALRYISAYNSGVSFGGWVDTPLPSGTWRIMGPMKYLNGASTANTDVGLFVTLSVRIS